MSARKEKQVDNALLRDGLSITAELDERKTTRHATAFKKYH